jgi:hypothetical protein
MGLRTMELYDAFGKAVELSVQVCVWVGLGGYVSARVSACVCACACVYTCSCICVCVSTLLQRYMRK